MEGLAFDTSFLIDFQNELRGRTKNKGAVAFLEKNDGQTLYLPAVAHGEYLQGFDDPACGHAHELLGCFLTLNITAEVAVEYAYLVRSLRNQGLMIGSNDLWIGACAKVAGLPLVTSNLSDFQRIEDLDLISYRPT
jgi:predicted nucleic acid-binding protein